MAELRFARVVMMMLAAGSIAVAGPEPAAAQVSIFRTGVEMVPLTVTVTDRSGRYLTDLTATDFAVLENGIRQPLSFFAAGEVPVDVALIVDASTSMRADMPLVRAAARGLLQSLQPRDRSAVMAVTTSVSIQRPFSTDHAATASGLAEVPASGASGIYDGLYVALKELQRDRQGDTEVRRKVLILLSDGLDNSSHLSAEDVAESARRVGAAIYVIVLSQFDQALDLRIPPQQLSARFDLRALATDTGGRSFSPTKASELPDVYDTIARELASQYDLGYIPQASAVESFRRVSVRVLPPTVGVARTRSGYYALSPTEAARSDEHPQPRQ